MGALLDATDQPTTNERRAARLLVILNPKAGNSTAEVIRHAMEQHFPAESSTLQFYETTGDEVLPDVVRRELANGYDLVVAAGGDGTVSETAEGLAGSDVPLGILPVGTANVLARDLHIPLDLAGACALLAGGNEQRAIDAMQVGTKRYFVSIGIGIFSLVVRDTPVEAKRRFGRLAYAWTTFARLIGYKQDRFTIIADGQRLRPRALLVIVANSPSVGLEPFRWGPDIRLDDGQLDVCVFSARTLKSYLEIAWNALRGRQREDPNVRYLQAKQSITIASDRPIPVQSDGELTGDTPIQIQVVPRALKVLVPASGGVV